MKATFSILLVLLLIACGCSHDDPMGVAETDVEPDPTALDLSMFKPLHSVGKYTPIEFDVVVYEPIEDNGEYHHWFSVECAIIDDTELWLAQVAFDFDDAEFELTSFSFNPTSSGSMVGWAWDQTYYPHFYGAASTWPDFYAFTYVDLNADPDAAYIDDTPDPMVKFCLTTDNENADPELAWNTSQTIAVSTGYTSLPYSTSIGN